jgi:hypothetical protein
MFIGIFAYQVLLVWTLGVSFKKGGSSRSWVGHCFFLVYLLNSFSRVLF